MGGQRFPGFGGLSREVLDELFEGVQVLDREWRYLYLNEAATRHGRRAREELLGRSMLEIYPGIEASPMFEALKRCMEERRPGSMENEFLLPGEPPSWFDLRFEPVPEGCW